MSVWSVMIAEHSDELGRFKRMLDSAFSGGATSSGKPGELIVFPLLVCCRDLVEEIFFAVRDGFGKAALRAVRTMYECVVVARFIDLHPEKRMTFWISFTRNGQKSCKAWRQVIEQPIWTIKFASRFRNMTKVGG